MTRTFAAPAGVALAMVLALAAPVAAQAPRSTQEATPRRINKAIELLEQGEPVYYFQVSGGGYELGLRYAQTWADAIGYNVEQAPFDAAELRAFIQGLVDGGPTKSGHRTPAVLVTLPVAGFDEATVRANHWMVEQALAAGAHGVFLVHARTASAVRTFVEAARYANAPAHAGLGEGLRGSGGQGLAARMWGITSQEYLERAEPWPLAPHGELLLGFKPEDRHALAAIDETMAVPGIGMVEWGPLDMSMSFGEQQLSVGDYSAPVLEARRRILDASKRHGVVFAAVGTNADNVVDRIEREGILFHFANEEGARVGRAHTGRRMPY